MKLDEVLRSSNNTIPPTDRIRQNNTTIMNNNFSKGAKKDLMSYNNTKPPVNYITKKYSAI